MSMTEKTFTQSRQSSPVITNVQEIRFEVSVLETGSPVVWVIINDDIAQGVSLVDLSRDELEKACLEFLGEGE